MTMRKFILLFVQIVAFNVLSSHAQMAQKYENSAIMNSSDYQDGNNYQKDFLLGNYIRINPAQKLMLLYPSSYSENINYKTLKYESINCKENCN